MGGERLGRFSLDSCDPDKNESVYAEVGHNFQSIISSHLTRRDILLSPLAIPGLKESFCCEGFFSVLAGRQVYGIGAGGIVKTGRVFLFPLHAIV